MRKLPSATNGESPDEWYEREKTAFRAWWESDDNEKTFSSTPTMAAGAGWFARAEAAPETAPIVPCLAPNGCTTPEWCARNGDACRVKTPVSETPRNQMAVKGCEPIKSPANVLVYAEEAGKALAEGIDKDEIEIRRAASAPSAIGRSEPDEDGERYRWFRNECAWFRRADIVEVAGEDAAMLDHYIDKGRCGL